mgnify:CR=1 FL=1
MRQKLQSANFNPRTREGCDRFLFYVFWVRKHFNPRTREGCDEPYTDGEEDGDDFNPRTREGCDRQHYRGQARRDGISIHAPARGATHRLIALSIPFQNFNPRTREGCDAHRVGRQKDLCISIHAPARGATKRGTPKLLQSRFQSTHPRGVRHDVVHDVASLDKISIHAPARGAT